MLFEAYYFHVNTVLSPVPCRELWFKYIFRHILNVRVWFCLFCIFSRYNVEMTDVYEVSQEIKLVHVQMVCTVCKNKIEIPTFNVLTFHQKMQPPNVVQMGV